MRAEVKTGFKIVLGIVAAVLLVVVGLGTGWLIWGRWLWAPDMMGGPGMAWGAGGCDGARDTSWGRGSGMMHGGRGSGMGANWGTAYGQDCAAVGSDDSPSIGALTIEDAKAAAEAYVDRQSDQGLDIVEVMEFEHNYYAILREHDTGVGAMELLIDKTTGVVGPEL